MFCAEDFDRNWDLIEIYIRSHVSFIYKEMYASRQLGLCKISLWLDKFLQNRITIIIVDFGIYLIWFDLIGNHPAQWWLVMYKHGTGTSQITVKSLIQDALNTKI